MSPHEADQRLWKIEYTALVNQYYYEILKRRWWVAERIIFALSLVASLVDFGILFVGWFGQASATAEHLGVLAGIMAAVILCLVLTIPVDSFYRHYEKLFAQWTELRGRCERLHLQLDPSDAGKVASVYLDELEDLVRVHTDIQKDEGRAHEKLLRWCQREINKRTYAVGQGTYEEVAAKMGAGGR
jgi:hypothetical protein